MSRLLFLTVIVAVVYWLLRSYRKQIPSDGNSTGRAEDMVCCRFCGVHLPKHESILTDGEYFCNEAHRLAHTNKAE